MEWQYSNEGEVISSNININFEKRDTKFIDTISGEKEMLNFSGFIMENDRIFISFPKHFFSNESELKSDAELLFSTIIKHYQENQKLYFNNSVRVKSNYPFSSFYNIYGYYKKYGIYHEEIAENKTGYNGNVLWKETLKKSSKVISGQNLLFLPLSIKKIKREQVFISECMIYAINYTLQKFSFFLNLPKVGRKSTSKNLIENKSFIIRELYSLKKQVFKDIHKKLLVDLINFFEQVPNGGQYYLKHYTFSSIWEVMVENYLNSHFLQIKSEKLVFDETQKIKNGFKKKSFYPNKENEFQSIQPDHYLEKNGEQFIFDAKYYNKIEGIDYKQIAYYFFLNNYSETSPDYMQKKYKKTHTALILPGNFEQRIHFRFKPNFNHQEKEFVVYEYYLDCKKTMKAYINNVKNINYI